MQNLKLAIELVPKSCFYNNIRQILTSTDWNRIRKVVLNDAKHLCEICGSPSLIKNRSLDCHEVWEFDDNTKIQKLVKIIAICNRCHEVKHYGLAEIRGNAERAYEHFRKMNDLSEAEANMEIIKSFNTWDRRSNHKWTLDISLIETYKRRDVTRCLPNLSTEKQNVSN